MKISKILGGFIGLAFLVSGVAYGATIKVPDDYVTIQAAIDSAVDGDTVLVSFGIYNEMISFYGKKIIVRSKRGPSRTIIEGDWIRFDSGETQATILEGFTINGTDIYASSPTIIKCKLVGAGWPSTGGHGSIYEEASPTFIDCKIIEGNAYVGGGFDVRGDSFASFFNCMFYNNKAERDGGALHIDDTSSVILSGCKFWRNNANSYGGAIFNDGGKVITDKCIINRNEAGDNGGGIWNGGALTLIKSLVRRNKAGNEGGGVYNSGNIYKYKTIIKDNNPNNIYEP